MLSSIIVLEKQGELHMKFIIDHDLHIHSNISKCSGDPNQTPERILEYAVENGLKTVCITDHFWDEAVPILPESWYHGQGLAHISAALPLPEKDGVRFLFGCETELDRTLTVGVAKEHYDLFDFIIVPTTHMHMTGYTLSLEEGASAQSRADAWVKRLDAVLAMDLPFFKVGIAHLTCTLIAPTREIFFEALSLIPEAEMYRLFKKAAALGVGIELNFSFNNYTDEEWALQLQPYRIAKACGCKFYLGSDAHTVGGLNGAMKKFERMIDDLGLTEDDKFLLKNIK